MALFKRKDKDGKRKGENAIGKIIYGFLLFMPLIAVGVACLYVVLNKNAFESYSSTYVQNLSKVNSNNFLVENGTYQFNSAIITESATVSTPTFTYSEINIDWTNYGAPSTYNYNGFKFTTNSANGNKFIYLYENGVQVYENHTSAISFLTNKMPFTFKMVSYTNNSVNWYNYFDVSYVTLGQRTLDNVFYYQLEKLEESDLFNWTKNTGAYTVMHNVTEGIGITNTYTPMLMTYWLLISVIYFIFDIALILVWAVHDKIHELKDAI